MEKNFVFEMKVKDLDSYSKKQGLELLEMTNQLITESVSETSGWVSLVNFEETLSSKSQQFLKETDKNIEEVGLLEFMEFIQKQSDKDWKLVMQTTIVRA
jgi:glutamate synthase domain-containing protein 2